MSDPTPQDEPANTERPSSVPSETIELEIAALEASLPASPDSSTPLSKPKPAPPLP